MFQNYYIDDHYKELQDQQWQNRNGDSSRTDECVKV